MPEPASNVTVIAAAGRALAATSATNSPVITRPSRAHTIPFMMNSLLDTLAVVGQSTIVRYRVSQAAPRTGTPPRKPVSTEKSAALPPRPCIGARRPLGATAFDSVNGLRPSRSRDAVRGARPAGAAGLFPAAHAEDLRRAPRR